MQKAKRKNKTASNHSRLSEVARRCVGLVTLIRLLTHPPIDTRMPPPVVQELDIVGAIHA